MNPKFLLIPLLAGVLGSCSTAYKSGQTPDDVYYSPVRYTDESQKNDQVDKQEDQKDYTITMGIRDRRWRDFDDAYDYRNSPYHYCNCRCGNYGYYYNPYYHTWPVYISKVIPVNTTPRMVNLNAYRGFKSATATDPKSSSGVTWVQPSAQYNNSNNSQQTRRVRLTPSNSSSNETRTYSPSSGNSSGSGSNSGSNGSGAPVSRPKRG